MPFTKSKERKALQRIVTAVFNKFNIFPQGGTIGDGKNTVVFFTDDEEEADAIYDLVEERLADSGYDEQSECWNNSKSNEKIQPLDGTDHMEPVCNLDNMESFECVHCDHTVYYNSANWKEANAAELVCPVCDTVHDSKGNSNEPVNIQTFIRYPRQVTGRIMGKVFVTSCPDCGDPIEFECHLLSDKDVSVDCSRCGTTVYSYGDKVIDLNMMKNAPAAEEFDPTDDFCPDCGKHHSECDCDDEVDEYDEELLELELNVPRSLFSGSIKTYEQPIKTRNTEELIVPTENGERILLVGTPLLVISSFISADSDTKEPMFRAVVMDERDGLTFNVPVQYIEL